MFSIGHIARTLAGSKKTIYNTTAFYNQNIKPELKELYRKNIEPRVSTMTNATAEKLNEYAYNLEELYQRNIRSRVSKIKDITATESKKYAHELQNSVIIHAPLHTISKTLPSQYRRSFMMIAAPTSHIALKAMKERSANIMEEPTEKRKEFNMQNFKKIVKDEIISATMTETAMHYLKNGMKNSSKSLPPLQKLILTTAICGGSHYLVDKINRNEKVHKEKENKDANKRNNTGNGRC